jgi:hypothetical protein
MEAEKATWNWTAKSAPLEIPEMVVFPGSVDHPFV